MIELPEVGVSMNQYRPEQLIRRAVFEHLRLRAAPVAFFFHVPNGGYHKPIEAAIMKGLGVKAGVPDIIVVHRGRCFPPSFTGMIFVTGNEDLPLATQRRVESIASDRSPFAVA